jgi:hypothetical protein
MNKLLLRLSIVFTIMVLVTIQASAINWEDYQHLDPEKKVPTQALQQALQYYDQIKDKISNPSVLTVIDYTQHSGKKRFYLIDMKTGHVEALRVAHGQGSDSNHDGWAEKYSNQPNSKATSIGFYLTNETYSGKYGLSLRLDGLSTTNNKARERAVVVHGAPYVNDHQGLIGRSWGCPALDEKISHRLIETIKNGSLIYAWGGQKTQQQIPEQNVEQRPAPEGT